MRHARTLIIVLASLACSPAPAAITPARVMTIDQAMSADRLVGGKISPDGRTVLYGVSRPDWDADRFVTELWIASVATGERYRLTTANKWDGASRWSPDGKHIAFLSDRAGANQIYVVRPSGGEAVRITNVDAGINAYRWAPNGKQIAFLTNDPEPESVKASRERYGDIEIKESDRDGVADFGRSHLWLTDVPDLTRATAPSKPVRLTSGSAFTINELEWSPSGRQIAFSAVVDPSPKGRASSDIYVLDVGVGKVTKLVDTPGPDSYPVWSPDGSQIAYETANGSLTYFETNRYVATVSVAAGTARLLTGQIDEQASLLAWGPHAIYVALEEGTDLHLYRLNPATTKMSRISALDRRAHQQWTFSADYRMMAFSSASASTYPELYITDLKNAGSKRLTFFNDQFMGSSQPTREVVTWRSADGTMIDGVLIKPVDFDPTRRYPLLVVVHGGPADVDRPLLNSTYAYPVDQLAAKGAIILKPNYRGSTAHGEAFRTPDPRTLSDYEDVLTGVKHLVDQGLAARDRIGVMGQSQGGYLAALLATKGSDWFKAASVLASVPNWKTYYDSGDAGYWAAQWFKATPLQDPDVFRIKSPISYAADAQTPVLIQHGENDRRAPIGGAYELYQTLKDRGVPAKMIVYKGAGHGIGSPKGQRALMEHNYEWFSRWIWNETPEPKGAFAPKR